MNITLDIETIPAQRPDVLAEIRATKQGELQSAIAAVKPPGNYKKPETIEAWMKEEAPIVINQLQRAAEEEIEASYRKTGLDGAYGQVCAIGFALDENEPAAFFSADDEYSVLQSFNSAMGHISQSQFVTIVGHNVSAFDLRFLTQRYIVNGIRPNSIISRAAQAKPWESDKVFDTMVQWAGVGNRVKLDKLCKALGIETPKGDIHGANVWDYVKAGHVAQVADYCIKDVIATREVFKRMSFDSGQMLKKAA
jgi:DNA polymerase elongation subunit (family B)